MDPEGKVLIIDDEEVVLDSCSQILDGSGYEVSTAPNGEIGLQLISEFLPDLVFVDLKMPGIGGIEVIRNICSTDPTIVVIVITGFATVSSAIEAMKNGAFDFLPKPFTPEEFRIIAQRGLEKRRLVLETISLRREKEMLRENFAAIVSHELKAPLGAAQQNLFALAGEVRGVLTEAQVKHLQRVQNSLSNLNSLIMTWLRVLSVDVSKIRESFRPVDIEVVIRRALEAVQPQADRKAIELVAPASLSVMGLIGDEGTLVETLVNILGNAVKYSRPSSTVDVVLAVDGTELSIAVSDCGVGIAKEDLPHIFSDFYAGYADETIEKGTGIGLAVARRVIEAHDGTITVSSEPSRGSTFTIHLPLVAAPEPSLS